MQPTAKRRNALGLVALIVAAAGLASAPFTLIISGVLLPVAFVLGVIGLCLPSRSTATSAGAIGVSVIGVVVSVVVFATLDSGVFDSSDPTKPAETPSATEDPALDAAPGTRENPLPIGETVTDPGWTVTLGTPREAGAEMAAEDQSNAAPLAGMEFWIVPVRVTYTDDTPMWPSVEVWVEFQASDDRHFRDGCGVIPDSLTSVDEMHHGDVAEANACVAKPAGTDGLWALTIAVFNDPVFFTAE